LLFAKTGFDEFDRKVMGLARQNLSIISGLPGSGKSTWLSQMALEVIQQNEKVALFSGELTPSMVMSWVHLQAAGSKKTIPTDFEGYFQVSSETSEAIDEWLDPNLFIFDNKKGNDTKTVMESMKQQVYNTGCKLIILDNLMTLDINKLEGNGKYEKQSEFFKLMKNFATNNNVHVAVVAHPRKPSGFLRVDDISGSGDIRALADNIWLVHRVNEDLKRATKSDMGWKDNSRMYDYTNLVEISKSRFNGSSQDYFVGFHFDVPSKRFKTQEHEYKRYAWETQEHNIMIDEDVEPPFDL
jgi:replicative DNA helicase